MNDIWENLKNQSLGRALIVREELFASALETIYTQGTHDFKQVCEALTKARIEAPFSQVTQWNEALLLQELQTLNQELDEAYNEYGRGA